MIRHIQSWLDSMALALFARRQVWEFRAILSADDAHLSDEALINEVFDLARLALIGGCNLTEARRRIGAGVTEGEQ